MCPHLSLLFVLSFSFKMRGRGREREGDGEREREGEGGRERGREGEGGKERGREEEGGKETEIERTFQLLNTMKLEMFTNFGNSLIVGVFFHQNLIFRFFFNAHYDYSEKINVEKSDKQKVKRKK